MNTVKMENVKTGQTADVHPDEVENYEAGGFVVVKIAPKDRLKKARKAKFDG